MSKSLGNLVFAKDLLKHHDAATIRLALMHYHYRIGGEWCPELLTEAQQLLWQFRTASVTASKTSAEALLREVRMALDDDLNNLEVIDALHRFVAHTEPAAVRSSSAKALTSQCLAILGLL